MAVSPGRRAAAAAHAKGTPVGAKGTPVGGTRGTLASALLGALAAAPVAGLLLSGVAPGDLLAASARGLVAEVDSVGWVLVPQLVLAVAILGLALQQGVRRAARMPRLAAPGWLSPAVESALLLGLLGTISGMVAGFAGVSPTELEPAPLVRGLGAALRSTFVGFAIALVGVWLRDDDATALALRSTGEEASPPSPPSGRPGTRP